MLSSSPFEHETSNSPEVYQVSQDENKQRAPELEVRRQPSAYSTEGGKVTERFYMNLEKVTDLTYFYLRNSTASRKAFDIPFDTIDPWHDFDIMVQRNLCKMGLDNMKAPLNISTRTWIRKSSHTNDRDFAKFDVVNETLFQVMEFVERRVKPFVTDARYSERPAVTQIGHTNSVLILNHTTPALVGLHYRADEFPNICATIGLENSVELRTLFNYMCVNQLRYGYVSTGAFTRVLKRTSMDRRTVLLSRPVGLYDPEEKERNHLAAVLCALAWQCKYGDGSSALHQEKALPSNGYALPSNSTQGFRLVCKYVAEAPIYSLKSGQAPMPGPAKWWKVRGLQRREAVLRFNRKSAIASVMPYLGIQEGEIKIIVTNDVGQTTHTAYPVIIKCASNQSQNCTTKITGGEARRRTEKLETEAAMYEYFENYGKLDCVPKCRAYGQIFEFLQILAIEPVGRPLRPKDVTSEISQQIRESIQQLHQARVLHGKIRLENFCIDNGKVRVINFSNARRYHVLYKVATTDELAKVEDMITRATQAAQVLENRDEK